MENFERLSLSAYWRKYFKGKDIMSEKALRKNFETLKKDKEFKKEFGEYWSRKLSPKQIELLNKEFIN